MHDEVWPWGAPPFYALIRGPFGRAGYQVATLARDDRPGEKIVLLFTTRERAAIHGRRQPQGHADWKVGPLPSWHRLHFFLESMLATAREVCLDFDEAASGVSHSISLAEVMPGLAFRATAERGGAGADPQRVGEPVDD